MQKHIKEYKELQQTETAKELKNCIASGYEHINIEAYKRILFNNFGLKLDLNTNGSLLKYYNTSNNQNYLCATCSAIDKSGHSFANVNGDFYKEIHENKQLYNEFKNFRFKYITTLKGGYLLTL